jgi:HEPN domain-containing protein
MSDQPTSDGLRERLTRTGEDALGKLAQDLLENPIVNGAIARAFEAREKAVQAQEVAMGALNLPSAADLERLTRRIRQVSHRLEGIEDAIDRLEERLANMAGGGVDSRLAVMDDHLAAITEQLNALHAAVVEKPSAAGRTRKPAAKKPEPEPAAEPATD